MRGTASTILNENSFIQWQAFRSVQIRMEKLLTAYKSDLKDKLYDEAGLYLLVRTSGTKV